MPNLILPTRRCFDDAIDFIEARLRHEPQLARVDDRLWLVHGICVVPEGSPKAGEPFAHAWVEERNPSDRGASLAWQGGISEGHRVWYAMPLEQFRAELKPIRATRYTLREAWEQNNAHGNYGPWEPDYVELCADRKAGAA